MATEIIFKKLYFYAIACVYTSEKHHRNNTQVCTLCEKKLYDLLFTFLSMCSSLKMGFPLLHFYSECQSRAAKLRVYADVLQSQRIPFRYPS